jgi:hypothetical protein
MHNEPLSRWFSWEYADKFEQDNTTNAVHEDDSGSSRHSYMSVLKYVIIFLGNVVIFGSVNGLYIYNTSQSMSPTTLVNIQISVAFFNVVWNMAIVPVLVQAMPAVEKL